MCVLSKIQNAVKVTKNLHNQFGNFNYRNVESIYESVKPILAELECSLVVSDEVVLIGDRFYIKATATIKDNTGAIIGEASAFAREALDKKGMDGAQITGSASSYARKYALGGLLLLDDNKDIDSQDNSRNYATPAQNPQNNLIALKKQAMSELAKHNIKTTKHILEYFSFVGVDKDNEQELGELLSSDYFQASISDFLAQEANNENRQRFN